MQPEIPAICGFDCPHAAFPPAESAGICRTMSAVWCGKLTALVNKNVPCEWRRRTESLEKKAAKARGAAARKRSRP